MLLQLGIRNFAIIDEVNLRLAEGLNVFSGETGTGKSIVIDAVSLLLGGRASPDFIRTGQEQAAVEAVFDLSVAPATGEVLAGMGVEGDGEAVLLAREIYRNGRSVARINGRQATVSMLRQVGQSLVDIHGQHEHQSLLRPERHLHVLDRYGGGDLVEMSVTVRRLYGRLRELDEEIRGLNGESGNRERTIDLLRYQVQEIDAARLRPGEEEELKARRQVLANAEKLCQAASRAFALLYEGGAGQQAATDILGLVAAELAGAAALDPSLAPLAETITEARFQVEEAARQARDYRDRTEFDPARLAEVETRLDLLAELKRKYGPSVSDILRLRDQAAAEIQRLRDAAARVARYAEERQRVLEELSGAAAKLSRLRNEKAGILARAVMQELTGLGMGRTVFEVAIGQEEDPGGISVDGRVLAVGPQGVDRVEFLISPNPGEPPRPLGRIASGGELARVMLALKCIVAEADEVPTLIFDEVDAGIGGRAAWSVAEKLAFLGRRRQVICVTHLPQIASMADAHFAVRKEVVGGRTRTVVRDLDAEERVAELARMLGGEDQSGITREHARALLEGASRRKVSSM